MILVKGRTCPMCQVAENFVEENGIDIEVMFNDEIMETVAELGIMSVPSIIDEDNDNKVYRGLQEVMPFLETLK